MKKHAPDAGGFLSLVLHAHLPFVMHHGTWPHGLEWLLEAAAETYLPLLRMVRSLQADAVPVNFTISLSPVLLEQLANPGFRTELPAYLRRKLASSREDAGFFELSNEPHLLSLAQHWERFFQASLDELERLDGDIVAGFRQAQQSGALDLLTSAATHGYVPLLGTDESVFSQFRIAAGVHRDLLGAPADGAWLPECGYRPAGKWHFPVAPEGMQQTWQPTQRAGTEAALDEAGLRFTVVDTHLVEGAERMSGAPLTPYSAYKIADSEVAVFARDPRTAFQVWSPQYGYPGDFDYLDFHKKRWPGGHRYWRVTGADLGMDAKQPYFPETAASRARTHAEHFVTLVADTLHDQLTPENPAPVLCAPFDLELFGHWWHEGLLFLEQVCRVLHERGNGPTLITCGQFLKTHGTAGRVRMPEGSWGANGDNSVWLNGETSSLLSAVYAAELHLREASKTPQWTGSPTGQRIARQLCRELLLMQSSDWPTLITTGAARDYAERRFRGHHHAFQTIHALWSSFLADGTLSSENEAALVNYEQQDDLFPNLNPADWKA